MLLYGHFFSLSAAALGSGSVCLLSFVDTAGCEPVTTDLFSKAGYNFGVRTVTLSVVGLNLLVLSSVLPTAMLRRAELCRCALEVGAFDGCYSPGHWRIPLLVRSSILEARNTTSTWA